LVGKKWRNVSVVRKRGLKTKGEKMKLTINLVGLCISMLLSGWCLGMAHFYYGNSLQSAALMIFISFPGLAGLYFSTKIKSAKLKWLLLVINYLFATYFNVLQFLFILFQTF